MTPPAGGGRASGVPGGFPNPSKRLKGHWVGCRRAQSGVGGGHGARWL